MRPLIKLRGLTDAPSSPPLPLIALRLRRSAAWPVGQVEAEFAPSADPPAAGDKIVVEGAADGTSLKPLFTGRVIRLQQGRWTTRILAEEATGPLTRLFIDKAIKGGTAAQVIQDLCGSAQVACSVDSPGATLPASVLLSNQSALDHICRLARLSGYMVRTDVNGKLLVGAPPGTGGSTKVNDKDPLTDLRKETDPDPAKAPTIFGDGALEGEGEEAATWMAQSLSGLKAGAGARVELLPVLKKKADLDKANEAESKRLTEAATRFTLAIPGIPPADIGEIIGLPDGSARIIAITLTWGARDGLLTTLDLHGTGG